MNQKPPQPADLHASAHEAYAEGNLPLALELYRKNLDRESNNFGIICRVGELLLTLTRFKEATEFLGIQLQKWPENVILNNLIASAYISEKNFDLALGHIERVLRRKAGDPVALTNKGVVLESRGHLALAQKEFKRVWLAHPDSALANSNYGAILLRLNKLSDAIAVLTRALELKPKDIKVQMNLANALQKMGSFERAVALYARILEGDPKNTGAIIEMASCKRSLGDLDSASIILTKIKSEDPNYLEMLALQGAIAADRGLFEKALEKFDEIVERDPCQAEVLLDRAQVRTRLLQFTEALLDLARYESLSPLGARYWVAKGALEAERKNHDLAVRYYRKARAIDQHYFPALLNLGHSFMDTRDFSAAIKHYESALAIKPGEEIGTWNLGCCYLHLDRYCQGWRYFECRPSRHRKSFKQIPLLQKKDLPEISGKKTLIFFEGGLGSTIQFARFVDEFVNRFGVQSIVFVQQELIETFSQTEKITLLPIGESVRSEDFDFAVSILSLPYLLNADLRRNNFLSKSTFFTLPLNEERRADHYAEKRRKKVGIVWRGSGQINRGMYKVVTDFRDLQLSTLGDLLKNPYTFYSFQLGITDEEKDTLRALSIQDLGSSLRTFNDSRVAAQDMDLVVTIDTAFAHLAGSMGLETHVVLPFNADWRWGTNQQATCWYPSVRLHRCNALGDWSGALSSLSRELA